MFVNGLVGTTFLQNAHRDPLTTSPPATSAGCNFVMFFFWCVSCWHCIVSDGHHYGQSLHCFGVFILDGVAKSSVQWLGSVHQKVYGYEPLATWIHTLKVVAVHECKFTPTVSFFTSCLHFNLPSCICVCPNTAPNHALNFRGAYRRKGRWWFAPGSFGSRPRQFLV